MKPSFVERMRRIAHIKRHGTVTVPDPDPTYRADRRFLDTQAAAHLEAKESTAWADGLTPAEYLETLLDRAQARVNPPKETPDE